MQKRYESTGKAVYIHPVDVSTLPTEVQKEVGSVRVVYAIHDERGFELALVDGKELAFDVARRNDYEPYLLN